MGNQISTEEALELMKNDRLVVMETSEGLRFVVGSKSYFHIEDVIGAKFYEYIIH